MNNKIVLIILLLAAAGMQAQYKYDNRYESKIDSIIKLMTLEEKAGQLNQLAYGWGWGPTVKSEVKGDYAKMVAEGKIGSFLNAVGADLTRDLQKVAMEKSRLHIPLIFGFDVIHGFKTTFPVPLAEVASWDPAIVEYSAKMQAKEAAATGIHWTFAPMVDIARDSRWGRIVEGAGEDTYLGSIMAAARVKGFQGTLGNENIAACVKHFAAYGAAEGGRDYNTVDISERVLRETYLPPFKAALDAGALTFMCSFNEIAGVPSSGSKFLLSDVLRNEWQFKGFVVSDWNSPGEMINHGFAADLKDAARISITAGLDMDMESRAYTAYLKELVEKKQVPVADVDESVRRVLRVKFILGLFDDPYKYCSKEREQNFVMSKEMQDAALKVAEQSIVLLKNNGVLPLKDAYKKIAVVGPCANAKKIPLGSWEQYGDSNDVVTVLEGIKKTYPKADVTFVQAVTITDTTKAGFDEAVQAAKDAELVIAVVGEDGHMSGEASCRASIDLPGVQNELVEALQKTGKPLVVVLMNGRALALGAIDKNADAVVEAWFPGITCGTAITNVLTGKINPSARLPITFPKVTGQIPSHYNHKNTGRPNDPNNHYTSGYLDTDINPLYPFGYGLSYTAFKYGTVKLSKQSIKATDKITVTVPVSNTGKLEGTETVQLYLRDMVGSVTRPVKELKRFVKVNLKPGESKDVQFTINEEDLKFWDINMHFSSEPGEFRVMVGGNSRDVQQETFTLE
ncbi:MAG: beta-glucosidase BglX [Ignavibacteriales bacterium]|nr:beta-glucosidase BglX [Ignavibacteriales bacterium]